jgi:hypothetical protein
MYTDLMVVISIQSHVTVRIDHGAATTPSGASQKQNNLSL